MISSYIVRSRMKLLSVNFSAEERDGVAGGSWTNSTSVILMQGKSSRAESPHLSNSNVSGFDLSISTIAGIHVDRFREI